MSKSSNLTVGIGKRIYDKGNGTISELRYGQIDITSPSKLIFATIKGEFGIYTLYNTPNVL